MKLIFQLIIIFISLACNQKAEKPKANHSIEEMKAKIKLAFKEDQEIRKQIIEKRKLGENYLALENKMHIIDSTNLVLALEFIDIFGWPKKSEVGKEISYGIFYIVQHSDHETMKALLPKLKAMADIGEAKKKHLGMMTDRVLMEENQKQIYGTQVASRKDENGYITNEYYIWPIQEPAKINALRTEMGFNRTIEEYAADMDASYSPDEKILPKKEN